MNSDHHIKQVIASGRGPLTREQEDIKWVQKIPKCKKGQHPGFIDDEHIHQRVFHAGKMIITGSGDEFSTSVSAPHHP